MRGFGDLVTAVLWLPWWLQALLAAAVVLWIAPRFGYRIRSKQVREAIRRRVRAAPSERDALAERALERAGHDPELLAELVREARKRTQLDLVGEGLTRLVITPEGRRLAQSLRSEQARPTGEVVHPWESEARIRALLDAGAHEAARARLDEALERFPDSEDLRALRAELASADLGG